MMMAHQESKQKSEWIKAVWAEKKKLAREQGVPHGRMRPAWIDVITKPHPKNPERVVTTGYKLNKGLAAVVEWIFEESLAGKGECKIGRALRERGVPCFQCKKWTPACIHNILSSRVVFGEYQQHERDENGILRPVGKPISGYYPHILTEEQFYAVQAERRKRRGKGGRQGPMEVNLFTHLVYDAETGTPLHSMTQTQHGRVYRYLANQNRSQIIPYPAFESIMLETLSQIKPKDLDGHHEEDALSARVKALQDEHQRLKHELEALDLQIRELPPERWPKRVVARIGELEQASEAKGKELREAKKAANTSGRTDSLTEMQTSIQLLKDVEGKPQEATMRQRIKMRVWLLVEGILVKVEILNRHNRFAHVWVYLCGSEKPRYFPIRLGRCQGALPADWENLDLKLPWR